MMAFFQCGYFLPCGLPKSSVVSSLKIRQQRHAVSMTGTLFQKPPKPEYTALQRGTSRVGFWVCASGWPLETLEGKQNDLREEVVCFVYWRFRIALRESSGRYVGR